MINKPLIKRYKKLREATYKKLSRLHHVEFLEGPRVLVLSPHPDDDVFGCGGTLIRHVAMGHEVHIVYLCRGDKGISGLPLDQVAQIRKEEATLAASIMLSSLPSTFQV